MSRCIVLSLMVISAGDVAAQSKPLAMTPRMANAPQVASVAAAERQGASWPRSAVKETPYATAHVDIGGPDRRCVRPFPGHRVARSGDFVIGAEIAPGASALVVSLAGSPRTRGGSRKIWWKPAHPPAITGAAFLLRGTLLGSPSDTIRMAKTSYATAVGSPPDPSTSFFLSGTVLPKSGDWLLIAVSGDDWGCFVVHE